MTDRVPPQPFSSIMASAPSPAAKPSPAASSAPADRAESAAIDASVKAPVLLLLGAAILWLLAGSAFALIASIKLHTPGFLADCELLTYGRVQPAANNALAYGWGLNAGLAVGLWLLARLARATLRHGGLILVAVVFLNLGVTLGVGGILVGDSTGLDLLEMPRYATPLIFAAYAIIGAWAVITLRAGRSPHTFISQWYVLAALFWFPWLYSVAQVLLVFSPVRGTVQTLVNVWFAHNLLALWFTPLGLAAIYYFLPKVLGRPLALYHLAPLGFWSLAIFSGWVGAAGLLASPVPAWVQSAGVAASLMTLVPVLIIALNHHLTLFGRFSILKSSLVLRFVVFGAICFTLTSLQNAASALGAWAEVTQFTYYGLAHAQGVQYAFFSMVMFGAIYFLLPRLLLTDWSFGKLMAVHFWASSLGIALYLFALTVGGFKQGQELNVLPLGADGKPGLPVPFLDIVQHSLPWLQAGTCALILLTVGHVAFAINFVSTLLQSVCPTARAAAAAGPVLLRTPPAMEVAAR